MTDMPVTTEEEPTVLHEYQSRRAMALSIAKDALRRSNPLAPPPTPMDYAAALTYVAEWILNDPTEEEATEEDAPESDARAECGCLYPKVAGCDHDSPELPDVGPLLGASIRCAHSCGCTTVLSRDGIRVDRSPGCHLPHNHWGPDPMPAGCGETTWTITERTTR